MIAYLKYYVCFSFQHYLQRRVGGLFTLYDSCWSICQCTCTMLKTNYYFCCRLLECKLHLENPGHHTISQAHSLSIAQSLTSLTPTCQNGYLHIIMQYPVLDESYSAQRQNEYTVALVKNLAQEHVRIFFQPQN
jgi:hypothetical protein